jgi:hypothetical protein
MRFVGRRLRRAFETLRHHQCVVVIARERLERAVALHFSPRATSVRTVSSGW